MEKMEKTQEPGQEQEQALEQSREQEQGRGAGMKGEELDVQFDNGAHEDGLEFEEDEDVFRNVGLGLEGHYKEIMIEYWQQLINEIESTNEPGSEYQDDFKSHSLPFARIRRVMKTDEEVKMISAEAPIIFAKACEVFITELTMRAWCVAEKHKRRTLQKADIAEALQMSDMFDFLIDIVPRSTIGAQNNSS
ncbi:related to Transcriptional activator HAP5 [Nakaseomyces glabratus]|nr:related to Transcriptional activator HAP5 [Nakaseomyces glabratus]SLM10046.1 related to Transcriptional activator HAP5 [Nakaseomyces glabratus]